VPPAGSPVRWFLVASLAFCCLSLAVGASARADEPTEYVPPADRALQPELPELAQCPSAAVPEIAEEEAEGEVEPVAPELRELGHLRLEQQEACKAQADRLDQVITRLWWVTSQTLALDHPDAEQAETNEWLEELTAGTETRDEARNEDLHQLRGLFEDAFVDSGSRTLRHLLLGGSEESEPFPVLGEFEAGPMEVDPELVSSVDAAGEAVQAGIYMIAGLLVGCFIGYLLWRSVHNAT
jgi:hypothetical protein